MSIQANLRGKIALIKKGLSFCRWAMEEGTVNFNKIIGGDIPKLNKRDDENEVGEQNDNECDEKDVDDDSNSAQ